MYLSQIILSREDCRRLGLFNRDLFHKFIHRLFNNDERSWLFNVETTRFETKILIQSDIVPPNTGQVKIQTKEISNEFLNCKSYCFTVTFCPEKRDVKSRRRHPISDSSKIEGFLNRRLQNAGLSIHKIFEMQSPQKEIYVKLNGNEVHRQYVTYGGIISVNNKNAFIQLISEGIGSGKGDGFGLIRLMPCEINN